MLDNGMQKQDLLFGVSPSFLPSLITQFWSIFQRANAHITYTWAMNTFLYCGDGHIWRGNGVQENQTLSIGIKRTRFPHLSSNLLQLLSHPPSSVELPSFAYSLFMVQSHCHPIAFQFFLCWLLIFFPDLICCSCGRGVAIKIANAPVY